MEGCYSLIPLDGRGAYGATALPRLIRWTVPVPMLSRRAVLRIPVPFANSALTRSSIFAATLGRPS
jgi:hypothetical protein